ncbi:MAG: hypothetical protein ACLQVL_31945 [Terriglobia bacterium]
MTKNSKSVAIVAIAAVAVVIMIFVARDLYLRHPKIVSCPDGPHPTVDIRDFTTQYWAYSVKLDASIADKAKVSTQLDPKLLAQVSDALQEARELRQFVVAGYNSCAITQPQYAQIEARFHAMDGLAREINELLSKPSISREGSTKLAGLISQYGDLARQRGSQ